MTDRPWMPLYIADYLADTAHLHAAQSGAYLHLIMHYWRKGGLPDNDEQLAAIARMDLDEWREARPTIQAFFQDGWRHKRIDAELAHVADVSTKRKKAADKRYANAGANAGANGDTLHTSDSQKKDDGVEGARPKLISEEATEVATAFLVTIGFPDPQNLPPEFCGVYHRASIWLSSGWPREMIIATARKIMDGRPAPPGVKYFEKAFANAFASLNAPTPSGRPTEVRNAPTKPPENGIQRALRKLRDSEAADGSQTSRPSPHRLLSHG